jgi:hypothetical protein
MRRLLNYWRLRAFTSDLAWDEQAGWHRLHVEFYRKRNGQLVVTRVRARCTVGASAPTIEGGPDVDR